MLVVVSFGFLFVILLLVVVVVVGVLIWGDVELVWWLDVVGCYGLLCSWLVVIGINGKIIMMLMLYVMLIVGGCCVVLCGNIGSVVLDVLDELVELLVVELFSF